MKEDLSNMFPLSKTKVCKGNRRLVREKIMQIIFAHKMSDADTGQLFDHIFNREFNFGDEEEEITKDKILRPDEVYELDADVPISWTEAEIKFAHNLLLKTLATSEVTDSRMMSVASNWDLERITILDRILIQIAGAEFTEFPDIPPKVTINEAIDIGKKYSTGNSGKFINGLLDAMLASLTKEGLINKLGRGLKDSKKTV